MPAYHFKLTSPDTEAFSMEIEVKDSQTFRDFHRAICEYLSQEPEKFASFFICDEKWRKGQEIACKIPGKEKKKLSKDALLMKKCKLKDFTDFDSKIVYEADFLYTTSLRIEMTDISPAKQKETYPVLTSKEGELPLRAFGEEIMMDEQEAIELKNSLLQDFESLLGEDFDEELEI